MGTLMEYKGYRAKIMEADKLIGDNVHVLPPGKPLEVYNSEEFIKWPENWMSGAGVYLVPVRANKGLWFDWTENSPNNTAIIPTIKGSNPITGLQTSGFHMERYVNNCPKHNKEFIGNRFCTECGYKWSPQNYVGPNNVLWWDGWFNQDDGTVRQFFFTEDELRDIATAMIGKENTVPAFGFAFYSPKERRPDTTLVRWKNVYKTSPINFNNTVLYNQTYYTNTTGDAPVAVACSASIDNENDCNTMSDTLEQNFEYCPPPNNKSKKRTKSASYRGISKLAGEIEQKTCGGLIMAKITDGIEDDSPSQAFEISRKTELRCRTISNLQEDIVTVPRKIITLPTKEVSIGAGAKIKQDLNLDFYPLDSWRDAPDSVMTIYFVFQGKFEELKAEGMRDFTGVKEGMLSGFPVG